MPRFIPKYKPVHKGVSIVGEEAYKDYRENSKVRNSKNVSYFTDYRRIARKIWSKIAKDSVEFESGVYAKGFLYLIPQVIDNKPFIELPNGRIKTNTHTDGDMYTPIFCNLFKKLDHYCWSLDGCFTEGYKDKMKKKINDEAPKYYFILPTLIKNNL